ncbi:MAG: Rrf2 family transcriptional regulator [Sphingorhabdus sp.]
MRLSVQTDYALRTLMFLAVKDGHHSIADIARAYGISKNHLMKVAQRLTAEGFVESVRGRSGGLKLARAPATLNVGAVVRIMEDTGAFVECFDAATNSCVVTPACGLRHALAGALDAFARHLDQFSVADLIPDFEHYRQRLDLQMVDQLASPTGSTEFQS